MVAIFGPFSTHFPIITSPIFLGLVLTTHYTNKRVSTTSPTPERIGPAKLPTTITTNESRRLIGVLCTHHAAYHHHQQVFMTCWWYFLTSASTTTSPTTTNKSWRLVGGFSTRHAHSPPMTVLMTQFFFSGLLTICTTHYHHKQVLMMSPTPERIGPAKLPTTITTNKSGWLVGVLCTHHAAYHHLHCPPTSLYDSLVFFFGLCTNQQRVPTSRWWSLHPPHRPLTTTNESPYDSVMKQFKLLRTTSRLL